MDAYVWVCYFHFGVVVSEFIFHFYTNSSSSVSYVKNFVNTIESWNFIYYFSGYWQTGAICTQLMLTIHIEENLNKFVGRIFRAYLVCVRWNVQHSANIALYAIRWAYIKSIKIIIITEMAEAKENWMATYTREKEHQFCTQLFWYFIHFNWVYGIAIWVQLY